LLARQEAAANAIVATEAAISAADAEAAFLAARLQRQRAVLRAQQAPASALLGGLAMMAQRPPLLALADRGGTDEFVRVRLLLDATMPIVRQRTAALSRQVARSRQLEVNLAKAGQAMRSERERLGKRQADFAKLEQQALRLAEKSGLASLTVGDVALSRGEEGEQLSAERQRSRSEAAIAAELVRLGPPPARPFPAEGGQPAQAQTYRLPADATVSDGFGSISTSGIRARGVTLGTGRGAPLRAPAAGRILFAGPYRSHDGVIIIDHGGGWKTLILNAAALGKPGDTLAAGAPLGRALGPISVELSRNGQHLSPALIAGSSRSLSKMGKSS
jgi:septal ring factor EnvC (AmiA/AmiB activator)